MVIIEDNWDDLEFAEQESFKSESKYESITRVSKTLFVGLFPLLDFLSLKWLSFITLSPELDRYIQGGLVLSCFGRSCPSFQVSTR